MGALNRTGALAGRVVGVYGSGGAPYPHLAYAAQHGASVRPVRAEDVHAGRLDRLDALVMPGGGLKAMAGLLAPLGAEGAARIRRFVEEGGLYVSSCAGSVLPLALSGAAAEALPEAASMRMVEAPLANPGDATLGGLASPGVGRIRVRLDPASPLAAGVPEEVELVHYNGPFFADGDAAPAPTPFAWPAAAERAFTPAERFLPGPDDGITFDRCVADGAAGGLTARVGDGRAVVFGSHPEFGLGPLQLGWGPGARLLRNALALAPARGRDDGGFGPWRPRPERPDAAPAALAGDAAAALRALARGFARLPERSDSPWLDADVAPSFHGSPPRELWRRDAAFAAEVADLAADGTEALAASLGDGDRGWLDDLPRPDQDVGAMGLHQLVARAASMRDRAEARLDDPPERPAHAYDGLDAHPFHLAVGTYLSAAGLVAAAAQTVAILAAGHDEPLGGLDALLHDHRAEARP